MKKKSLLKKLAIGAGVLAVGKAMAYPLFGYAVRSLDSSWDLGMNEAPRVMNVDSFAPKYVGSEEDVALKFLKLAHASTMKHMDYTQREDQPVSVVAKLYEGKGDCSESSEFTYGNYLRLVKNAGRDDLTRKVRHAGGLARIDGDEGGYHAWLEIKREGKWIPYETTANDLRSDVEIEPGQIDSLVRDEDVMGSQGWSYSRYYTTQFDASGNGNTDLHAFNALNDNFFGGVFKQTGSEVEEGGR